MEDNGINLPKEKRDLVTKLNLDTSALGKEALNNINTDNSVF